MTAGQNAGEGGAKAPPAPTGHSRFGASGADRFLNCTASVKAQEGETDTPSEYAKEGTALHAVSSHCLESGQDAIEWVDRAFNYEDHGSAETIEIDEDQAEAVQVYLDTIRADKAELGGKLLIERRFHLEWLHPEFYGTADCSVLGFPKKRLRVYDAKFGRGVAVEVVKNGRKNPQLAYYGLGAIEDLRRVMLKPEIEDVELIVIQPRAHHRDGPVRRVVMTHDELLDLSADLVDAATKADGPDATFAVGDWCKFCRAAHKCRALRNFALSTAQADFDDETGAILTKHGEKTVNPLEMSDVEIANALDAADIISDWVSAVRQHGAIIANNGYVIPRWKLVPRRALRKWIDAEKAAAELTFVHGIDSESIFAHKLKSPAQVEQLLPKGERHALAPLYSKESSGNTLVRETDERPEAQSRVQSDFDDDAAPPGAGSSAAPALDW